MRRAILGLVISLLSIGIVILGFTKPASATSSTPTPSSTHTATVVPTAIPLIIQARNVYFHPSGIFSISQVEGWQLQNTNTYPITDTNPLKEIAAVFLNNNELSVIHAFTNYDPVRHLVSVQDQNKFADAKYLAGAWSNYESWKETGRKLEAKRLVVNFDLTFGGQPYLGRQISRVEGDWFVVLRLVVPKNNPQLLNDLEKAEWSSFAFYTDATKTPTVWLSQIDTKAGYLFKYPQNWVKDDTANNQIIGTAGQLNFKVSTKIEPNVSAKTDQASRHWVITLHADAKILSVIPEARTVGSGFSLSYSFTDQDGKPISGFAVLLNAPNKSLVSAEFIADVGNTDLLLAKFTNPSIVQLRNSLVVFTPLTLPQAPAILTPTIRPTPTLVIDPASLDISTTYLTTSSDHVLSVKLPSGWYLSMEQRNSYKMQIGAGNNINAPVLIAVTIDDAQTVYSRLLDSDLTFNSPREALEKFKTDSNSLIVSEIRDTTIGKYPAVAATFKEKDGYGDYLWAEIRLAQLNDTQVILETAFSIHSSDESALIDAISQTIEIHLENIPTLTPSLTPYPLQITATALQEQFNALTESPTPSITPTASDTATPSATNTVTPTLTPTKVPTSTATLTPIPASL